MNVSITTKVYQTVKGVKLTRDIIETIPVLGEVGFKHLDWSLNDYASPKYILQGDDWEKKLDQVGEVAEKCGVKLHQAHAPSVKLGSFVRNAQFADPAHMELYKEGMRKTILACGKLDVKWLFIHPLTCPEYNYERKATLEENIRFWSPYVELAEKNGVGIAFENQLPFLKRQLAQRYCSHYEDLIEFVDSFADPMVGICWDTGHANQSDFDQYRALTAVGHRLKALHLHDNHYGNKDEHLLPFMGEVKWEDVIRALVDIGYDGTLNYESAKACSQACGEAQMQLIRLSYENACYLNQLFEEELAKKNGAK